MGIRNIVLSALGRIHHQEEIRLEERKAMTAPQWDLSRMPFEELLSPETLIFLFKVLFAASVVAFGPALVLEYVPTKKVDVGDMTNAGSQAGKTQRLLLAFAGGGLMAEAALHLLPHLFMPHEDHHEDHHEDSHHHQHDGLGDSCKLIALGFLAAFAIDRFASGGKKKAAEAAVPATEASAAVDATKHHGVGMTDNRAPVEGVDNDEVVAESLATPAPEAAVAVRATARDGSGTVDECTAVGDVQKDVAVAESPATAAITSGGPTSSGDDDKVAVASAPPDAEHTIDRDVKTDPEAAIPAADTAVPPAAETVDVADECIETAGATTKPLGDEAPVATSSPPAPTATVSTTAKDGESVEAFADPPGTEATEASNNATAGQANSSVDPGITGASAGQVGEVPPVGSVEEEGRARESPLSSGAEDSAATAVLASAHLRPAAIELAGGIEVISKPLLNEEKQPQDSSVHPAEAAGSAGTTESTESSEPSKPSAPVDSARTVKPTQPVVSTDAAAEPATPEQPVPFPESAAEPATKPAGEPTAPEQPMLSAEPVAESATKSAAAEPTAEPAAKLTAPEQPVPSAKPVAELETKAVAESVARAFDEPVVELSEATETNPVVFEEPRADANVTAVATSSSESTVHQPELTLYGNPRTPTAVPRESTLDANEPDQDDTPPVRSSGANATTSTRAGGDSLPGGGRSDGHDHHGHHDDHHGDAEAGAYVTLAVDFLHNVIDGIGIGAAYALGGDSMGHTTALLKLIHELQHEVGDVATLVQCGMSKHHAIHIQHTTAAGVFVGVAISLGASVFPAGLLTTCLALSAGATFHLASGTVLGPVLAIPAEVGGSSQGVLEIAALAAGAAGVVALGLAEKWAGVAH